ncbi:MAG: type VII secretion protein EssC [Butyrivibrio sp.]
MNKTILPDRVTGQYWIKDVYNGKQRDLICVEAVDGKWIARSNEQAQFYDAGNNLIKSVEIKAECVYILRTEDDEKSLLFADSYSDSGREFHRLHVSGGTEISIGRNESNTICYVNKFVSGKHVIIKKNGDSWTVQDCGSTNGTYVNNRRTGIKTLLPGDVVSILGLRIVIGYDFISINNPNHQVVWDSDILKDYAVDNISDDDVRESNIKEEFFYRSPRLKKKIEPLKLKISPPSAREDGDRMPMAMVMGPSLTMGLGSATTGVFSVINGISRNAAWTSIAPTVAMSFSMLCGMILWPILTKRAEKKNKIKQENKRQERYHAYLMEVRDTITREANSQSEILTENNVSLTDCENIIMIPMRNLWERAIGQDDFLNLRVGIGDIPMWTELSYPERTFTIDEDILQDDLQALVNEQKILKQVPITFSLLENNVSGVIGENHEEVMQFVKGLIVRIAATHSYDEVKLMVFCDEDDYSEWEFVKWIPHIWNNEKSIRYFANNENDAKELFSLIDKTIDEFNQEQGKEVNQYFIIINASRNLTKNSDTMKRLSTEGIKYGFLIINVSDGIHNLPKDCSKIIEINSEHSKIYDKNDVSGECLEFNADLRLMYSESEVAHKLSNIKLDLTTGSSALPNMLTFLDMYKVGKIEHLNSLTRWKENNPIVTLKAPVGVDSVGNLFYLDLHEKFQGPHGLVAGMTGSGKSEFIITYILSMAVNYHPDEVAFILIDYKGGGLAGAFEDKEKGIKLPHLAGTITNLDGASVNRSLISIQSELRKRQAIFNEARKISNEGTIDIYKYQKLYRDGVVSVPVPHLFIISDEFAELKSQQPEFMQQLISAARIGRSLGVHLILATQKPSGVVDDQIWSNSRFRVCLKVQEKSDSMDMIKRPDAAELSATGRFYLQVGFNEFFDIGQSAWCGAPYIPTDLQDKKETPSIQVIDNLGRIQKELKLENKAKNKESKLKQIVGIVNYLSDLAKDENISVSPLWLDEIPEKIYLKNVINRYNFVRSDGYGIEAVIGIYDDPFNQKQDILTLSLTDKGNTIIYGNAVSGKEIFLTTFIFDLCNNYSPEYLNLYVMDFGTEMLQMFSKAPQVGDVILSSDGEKVVRLMKMLKNSLKTNKKLLSEAGGSQELYFKSTGHPIQNTVVIINNFAALNELYEDVLEDISYLTREGPKYGIFFIFTASTGNEIKYRIAQNCAQNYVLQMNDKSDYVSVLGNVEGVYPSKLAGRGIIKNEHVYEFQTARICPDEELQELVKFCCEQWTDKYIGLEAKPVAVIPEILTSERYTNTVLNPDSIPVGIEVTEIEDITFDFTNNVVTPIFAKDFRRVWPFVSGILKLLSQVDGIQVEMIEESITEEKLIEIFNTVALRNNQYKKTHDNSSYNQYFYFIKKPGQMFDNLGSKGRSIFAEMTAKCEPEYNVHFIICDDFNSAKKYTAEEWFKKRCDTSTGIWIGDGFDEQYILKSDITLREARTMKNDLGLVIKEGETFKVKIICDTDEKGETV